MLESENSSEPSLSLHISVSTVSASGKYLKNEKNTRKYFSFLKI